MNDWLSWRRTYPKLPVSLAMKLWAAHWIPEFLPVATDKSIVRLPGVGRASLRAIRRVVPSPQRKSMSETA
jgi:hypothetical protein